MFFDLHFTGTQYEHGVKLISDVVFFLTVRSQNSLTTTWFSWYKTYCDSFNIVNLLQQKKKAVHLIKTMSNNMKLLQHLKNSMMTNY